MLGQAQTQSPVESLLCPWFVESQIHKGVLDGETRVGPRVCLMQKDATNRWVLFGHKDREVDPLHGRRENDARDRIPRILQEVQCRQWRTRFLAGDAFVTKVA